MLSFLAKYALFLLVMPLTVFPVGAQQLLLPEEQGRWQDDGYLLLSLDTSLVYVWRRQALLDRARAEVAQYGWKRLLPSVVVNFTANSRNLVFAPVQMSGSYEPLLNQWPGDSWTLSISWNLNALVDTAPVRKARANLRIAEFNLALAVLRRRQNIERLSVRDHEAAVSDSLFLRQAERSLFLLTEQMAIKEEILSLLEMKYEQGEVTYESLAEYRVNVLALRRQIVDKQYEVERVLLRRRAAGRDRITDSSQKVVLER